MLLLNIVFREPSNPLLKLFGNYGKLRKRKPKATFLSQGLRVLNYITDQSKSQSNFAISRNNADGTESF